MAVEREREREAKGWKEQLAVVLLCLFFHVGAKSGHAGC